MLGGMLHVWIIRSECMLGGMLLVVVVVVPIYIYIYIHMFIFGTAVRSRLQDVILIPGPRYPYVYT